MIKPIIILAALTLGLFAKGEFTETRYIYALNKTTIINGSMSVNGDKTVVKYTSPIKKILTQQGNRLTIEDLNAKTAQTVDLTKRMDMNLYFSFMRAVNNKDIESLNTHFNIAKNNKSYILLPKGNVKKAINKIEILTNKKSDMELMTIYFKNRDTIEIETL
jgi:hypothetical protein